MCGIAGLVNLGDGDTLSRMTEVQRHRGPDDGGCWEHRRSDGGYVGLGSRRLAIIDRSSAGHMPMSTEDGEAWIVYNGEVYNFPELRRELEAKGHRFRSGTDTEVVLRLYREIGPDFVRRLEGMFALAVYDLRDESLLLARDPFGIKPLYYYAAGQGLAFASEMKALLMLPGLKRRIDPEALHKYLTFLWVPEPDTILQDVKKLPPGYYARYQGGHLHLEQYWDLSFPAAGAAYPRSKEDLASEVRTLLQKAVRSQMISDVPLGAFLSAGLDSSAIVALMAQASPRPVKTFTVTFPPSYRVGESTFDDPAVARRTAEHFGCDHHEIVVEPEVADLLPKIVWHMDEPVADPAIIASYLVCQEAKSTATVLLSGVGGDELFAGYRKHMVQGWSRAYRWLPGPLRRGLLEPAIAALPSMRGTPIKGMIRLGKKMARSASLSPEEGFLMNSTYLTEEEKAQLYLRELAEAVSGMDPWSRHREHLAQVQDAHLLNRMLYVDTKAFLPSLNLNYTDKTGMASSLEVRVPFLDRDLVGLAARDIPPHLKLRGGILPQTKYILREAMRGLLPAEVLRQPKAGFAAPVDYWLARDLHGMVDDLLSTHVVNQRGYFNSSFTDRMIREQREGRRDWSMQIWQLMTLELWMREFLDGPQ